MYGNHWGAYGYYNGTGSANGTAAPDAGWNGTGYGGGANSWSESHASSTRPASFRGPSYPTAPGVFFDSHQAATFHPTPHHPIPRHHGLFAPLHPPSSSTLGYHDPINYPPQYPGLDQQLSANPGSNYEAREELYDGEGFLSGHTDLYGTSSSTASSPVYENDPREISSSGYSTPFVDSDVFSDCIGQGTADSAASESSPRYGSVEPGADDGDMPESPLKFVPRSEHASDEISEPPPFVSIANDVDPRHVQSLFMDCEWRRSERVWLDDGVWSEYITFDPPISLTRDKTIHRLERVHGMPSELPQPSVPTAFLLEIPEDLREPQPKPDSVFRDGCPHSYKGSTGNPSGDTTIPGLFFPGRRRDEKITVRRAVPFCRGIMVCESLDTSLILFAKHELSRDEKERVSRATLRQRELQGTTRIGQVFIFIDAMKRIYCRAICADGKRCTGIATIERLSKPKRGKEYGLACSKRHVTLTDGSGHLAQPIPPHIDEGLLRDALDGKQVIDPVDEDGKCSQTLSLRQNHGAPPVCGFEHSRDGRKFQAAMSVVSCGAKITFFCPVFAHSEIAHICIAYPHHDTPHTHVTAAGTKCPHHIREEYKGLARQFGPGVTVAKLENSQIAKDKYNGKTPSQHHPGLIDTALKTRLIVAARQEVGARVALSANEEIAAYVARQATMNERYIHSSSINNGKRTIIGANRGLVNRIHKLHSIDFDTSHKPVDGDFQMFEINGWLASHACTITIFRVWMEAHDRASFTAVWIIIIRLIFDLTSQRLRFKRLHAGGTINGVNSDMEAAPLLALADVLWGTITDARKRDIGDAITLLSYILRVCNVHFDRGIDSKELNTIPLADRDEIRALKDCESPAAFALWEQKMDELIEKYPDSGLDTWRKHKYMHRWLIPAVAQTKSNIPIDDWHFIPPNTNVGEGQHHWNNVQTGTSMRVIESFKKYEELDAATEARLTQAELTGDLRNPHNNPVDRCVSATSRRIGAAEGVRRTRAADETVRMRQVLLLEAKEQLTAAKAIFSDNSSALNGARVEQAKQVVANAEKALELAQAEVSTNSSGRVPLPRVRPAVTAPSTSGSQSQVVPAPAGAAGAQQGAFTTPSRPASREQRAATPPPVPPLESAVLAISEPPRRSSRAARRTIRRIDFHPRRVEVDFQARLVNVNTRLVEF